MVGATSLPVLRSKSSANRAASTSWPISYSARRLLSRDSSEAFRGMLVLVRYVIQRTRVLLEAKSTPLHQAEIYADKSGISNFQVNILVL